MPINLINSTGQTRNEDPKFSTNDKSLFFKQDDDVTQAVLSYTSSGLVFTPIVNLTRTASTLESSMPPAVPDGTAVFYTTNTGSGMGLYKQIVGSTAKVVFDTPIGLTTYYPIACVDGTVFYARWHDATSQADRIYTKVNPSDTSNQFAPNDCNSNNSDPSPVNNTNYVFFSSTSAGGYQLYLGDASTGQRWSLSQLGVNSDTTKAKLGPNYYAGAPTVATKAITLLSQSKPASASSSYSAGLGPTYAFDDNTTSMRRDSMEGVAGAQWLMVDPGATRIITDADLHWDVGAKVYPIQTSSDGVSWTSIYSTPSDVSRGHTSFANLEGSGRYIRVYDTQRAT